MMLVYRKSWMSVFTDLNAAEHTQGVIKNRKLTLLFWIFNVLSIQMTKL